ncbi:MAG: protein-tyrosine-phosphatase [Cyclobacteriaceae bacterium]|nr:protein-tyrosine-phosphatase [Cyclobacteriaceae bacterium]
MKINKQNLFPEIQNFVDTLKEKSISKERVDILQPLIKYIQQKIDNNKDVKLNFICTHNSRRSQFSQIWAQTMATNFGIKLFTYSGGVEVTAFNDNAVAALNYIGFKIQKEGNNNPLFSVQYSDELPALKMFSKKYDDSDSPSENFAAIMTCSHADENCPFIPGAEIRIPIMYDDPKKFDNTPKEAEMYRQRSEQIAAEMYYIFSHINS